MPSEIIPKNLFSNHPEVLCEEAFENLISKDGFRVERIVSRGHASPKGFWYDQGQYEWVAVLKGRAGLLFEGDNEILVLDQGDHVIIPPHKRHRVEWTDSEETTVWLAIHYDGFGV